MLDFIEEDKQIICGAAMFSWNSFFHVVIFFSSVIEI